jgi:hypothetical protein
MEENHLTYYANGKKYVELRKTAEEKAKKTIW